jgi:NADP-reducing hydrogenase subunit HndB
MPKLKTLEDLKRVRDQARKAMRSREAAATRIIVGMGTCGIAAGAREVLRAILGEPAKRGIEANVTTVGCIGMCSEEPLVDIIRPGEPRITYGHMTPGRVPTLIEQHLVRERVIREWVVAQVPA